MSHGMLCRGQLPRLWKRLLSYEESIVLICTELLWCLTRRLKVKLNTIFYPFFCNDHHICAKLRSLRLFHVLAVLYCSPKHAHIQMSFLEMRSFVMNIVVPNYFSVCWHSSHYKNHLATITVVCELLVVKKMFRH